MRKKIGIIFMLILLLGVAAVSQTAGERLRRWVQGKDVMTAGNVEKTVIVVDSGHGGSDPGKIGVNQKEEKDINLQIAQKVQKKLEEQKIDVVMTRETENGLGDSKVEDLKARVALINQSQPTLAISIHQNSYPEESIHGAQVFYYTHSKEGEEAAKLLQQTLLEVDPENHRQAKANDTYYMLKKTEHPLVIIECGFLSNQKEAELLCDDAYQEKIAAAIVKGIMEYLKRSVFL